MKKSWENDERTCSLYLRNRYTLGQGSSAHQNTQVRPKVCKAISYGVCYNFTFKLELLAVNLSSGVPNAWNLILAQVRIEGVLGVLGSKLRVHDWSVNENSLRGCWFILVLIGERTFLAGLFSVIFLSLIGEDATMFPELSSLVDASPTQFN